MEGVVVGNMVEGDEVAFRSEQAGQQEREVPGSTLVRPGSFDIGFDFAFK